MDTNMYSPDYKRQSWRSNVEYHPEHFLLTVIDVIETGGAYEFDTSILWQHANGTFWYAHDSGCSCPTPFEGYDFNEGLEQVRNLDHLEDLLKNQHYNVRLADVIDMRRKAQAAGL